MTRKIACHPATATAIPPTTGPTAAMPFAAIDSAPSVPVGAGPSPATARTIARPAGNAAAVPNARSMRASTSDGSDGASGASRLATTTIDSPPMNTRRGPKRSARRPIAGWPTAPTT